jgi:uroporphyrinogen III methyltransferase/synthase
MANKIPVQLRIGICGSASVGKTSLTNALASDLELPCLREEMRDYLEATGVNLASLPASETAAILMQLWKERAEKEQRDSAFIADNCPLDFAAYALYYGCLNGENSDVFLSKTLEYLAKYDAIFVLPWGILPYAEDGIRPASQHLQLRYQLILEGLLRKHVDPQRLHFLPENITDLEDRSRWIRSLVLSRKQPRTQILLNKQTAKKGFVYLVGAGPGNPELLTLRANELLQSATVVAYDSLISPEILARAPADAELLPVGRRHGAGACDYRLHPKVLARAQEGQVVVRLKCGDPFLFGRGGEEAEELTEAGIPFEIVPGVSAAFGAAAYAGIPLTHRNYASEVIFRTGHDAADTSKSVSIKALQETIDRRTTVLYMAARRLQANLDRLIKEGNPPDTPAALVANASMAHQQVCVGTLATLPRLVGSLAPEVPALLIVGRVVDLRSKIAWLETKILHGSRILVARARTGASAIAQHLRTLGASVVEAPSILAAPLDDYSVLDAKLNQLHQFHAVVFGCAESVRSTLPRLAALHLLHAIAFGEHANKALLDAGIIPMLAISGSCRKALEEHSSVFTEKHLLLITSSQGRSNLYKELCALSATVETAISYQSIHNFMPLTRTQSKFDLVVLPSSSAASLLLSQPSSASLSELPMIAMGPVTEAAARLCGATNILRAPDDSIESIVSCVIQQLALAHTTAEEAEQTHFADMHR